MVVDLLHGDSLEVMATLPPDSVDVIITDPPYGIGFMGKGWDHGVPGAAYWREALRVAKPGAHIFAFGGTRMFHHLAVAIEHGGWVIRDCMMWLYGSGFPKSHNVSKAIDKAAGAQRDKIRVDARDVRNPKAPGAGRDGAEGATRPYIIEAMRTGVHYMDGPDAVTDDAKLWEGYGTALKPAWEPIIIARKPMVLNVAENVLAYGTGALHIDACRIAHDDEIPRVTGTAILGGITDGWASPWKFDPEAVARRQQRADAAIAKANELGRWPANVVHDGSAEATAGMGAAARYFYTAKASRNDRDDGCHDMPVTRVGALEGSYDGSLHAPPMGRNDHPTVKPTDLMTWLCRLAGATGKVVLDPFCGSGSTGRGAMNAGAARFVGVDVSEHYLGIAQRRINALRRPMDAWLNGGTE